MLEIIMWVVAIPSVFLSLPLWGWILANFDLFFTFVNEGEAKVVMKGGQDLSGQLVGFLFHFDGWKMLRTKAQVDNYRKREIARRSEKRLSGYTNDYLKNHLEIWEIVPLEGTENDNEARTSRLNRFLSRFGYQYFGFSPFYRIASWEFTWVTIKVSETRAGETKPEHKTERVSSIFLKETPYYSEVSGKYTREEENAQMSVGYIMGLSCRNPYKALFKQHRWFDGLTAISDQRVTSFIMTKIFTEIQREDIKKGSSVTKSDFFVYMQEVWKESMERFGHFIGYSRILTKAPHGGIAENLVNATANIELSKRTGIATEELARKEANAEVEKARGKKAAEESQVAGEVAILEARKNFTESLAIIAKKEGGQHALNTMATLALADNAGTNTLIVSGDGQGATGAIAGLANAVMGQINKPQKEAAVTQTTQPPTAQP